MTADEFKVILAKVESGEVNKDDMNKYAQYLILKNKFEPVKVPFEYDDEMKKIPKV